MKTNIFTITIELTDEELACIDAYKKRPCGTCTLERCDKCPDVSFDGIMTELSVERKLLEAVFGPEYV